jgi:acetylornithine deacetylase/succinyl-diaminopimelate desuccinylase-like protein
MELFPTDWIDRIIGINSETERSNAAVVAFLRPLLEASGLKIQEQQVREGGETFTNLIAFNQRPDHPDLLLFNTHLDTVSGGNTALWTKTGGNPFKATRVRDRIYGLGTADVKIDFLCKLWALRQAGKIDRPVALVGTYGEERGLIGVQQLFAKKLITPRFAVVGEPSDLELIYAHKGHVIACASLPLEKHSDTTSKSWKGKAAHSSTPALGVNALRKGFTEIFKKGWGIAGLEGGTNSNRVPESATARITEAPTSITADWRAFVESVEKLEKSYRKIKDSRFSPSVTTLSWNLARTVGNRAEVTFDFRTLPGVDALKLRAQLEKLLPASGRWKEISVDLPLAGDKDNTLMKNASRALKACGVTPKKKTKASSTEAAVYHHHGAQAIVFGPGISVNNVHKPNEHNLLSQIRVATQFYKTLLQQPWEGL